MNLKNIYMFLMLSLSAVTMQADDMLEAVQQIKDPATRAVMIQRIKDLRQEVTQYIISQDSTPPYISSPCGPGQLSLSASGEFDSCGETPSEYASFFP